MTTVLFISNLVLAGIFVLVIWRLDRVRDSVVFHVGGFLLASGLYLAMGISSAAEPINQRPDHIPAWFIFHLCATGAVYLPFAVFLVYTYVRLVFGESAAKSPPVDLQLNEAEDHVDLGRLHEAAALLKRILARDPDNPRAHKLMADLQIARGDYEKAIGSLRLAMPHAKDDHQFAQFVFQVAEVYVEHLGDYTAAARELDLVRKRLPDTPEADKAHKLIVQFMAKAAEE